MASVDWPRRRLRAVGLGLFLGTLLLFSRAVRFGFTNYDDPRYITNNPHVQAGLSWDAVRWAFAGRADYWQPVTWLSHILDWQLYGDRASGHHLTSLVWHALNAVLVLLVFRRLTGAFGTSALCAALFAWHPLRVESVVWITERKDLMSGFFFLLTVGAYTVYAEKRRARAAARLWYAVTLAGRAGGLMCKPMLVTLPGVLLLLDFWPLRRFGFAAAAAPVRADDATPPRAEPWTRLVLEKVPFLLFSIAAAVATVRMQETAGAFTLALPPGARLANAVVSIPRYLGKFFWPFNLTVCYAHPGHWPTGDVAAATALGLAVTAVAGWQCRARPWLLTGWLWFLGMLVPVLGLLQTGFQAMADRYTYLPILGVQLALLWTLREVPAPRALRAGLAALVLGGLAVRTWNQEGVWRDSATLYEHALAVTSRNYVAHFFLGATMLEAGRTDAAAAQTGQAVAINPDYLPAQELLGDIRQQQGRFDDAVHAYRQVLRLDPRNARADYALGVIRLQQKRADDAAGHFQAAARQQPGLVAAWMGLAQADQLRGRPEAAVHDCKQALARDPDNAVAQFALGLALEQLGRTDEALAAYTRAAQLRPGDPEVQIRIGTLLLNRGEAAQAGPHFQAALDRQPHSGPAHLGLGLVAEQLGRAAEAVAHFQRALACTPDDPAIQRAWGDTLARDRRFDEAIAHYRAALRLRPNDAATLARLGFALYLTGRRTEAIQAWEHARRLDPNLPGLRERLEQARQTTGAGSGDE